MESIGKQAPYDIIGDIHGCHQTLLSLLAKLGYCEQNGVYQHATRRAIFLGDFVDRCSGQRGVIDVVRPMIESGAALAVMGNHEYNAIAYYTKHRETGQYLREHSKKNKDQHQAFLDAYQAKDDRDDVIQWFKTLPFWLDLGEIRIVHACWDKRYIEKIASLQGGNNLTDDLLEQSSDRDEWQFQAIETLLKGKEIRLPAGKNFKDKNGNIRHHIRVKWWDNTNTTYRSAFMGPESALTHIPEDKITGDHLIEYAHDAPPVFLGHYWMEGEPEPLSRNIACLDYSVAEDKRNGFLTAYRWNGEQVLSKDNFVQVKRDHRDTNI